MGTIPDVLSPPTSKSFFKSRIDFFNEGVTEKKKFFYFSYLFSVGTGQDKKSFDKKGGGQFPGLENSGTVSHKRILCTSELLLMRSHQF